MKKDIVRQWVVVVAVIATLAVNFLAVTLPLNGQNTGAISDRFKVYFVPAGYVFSIWGIIYLGIIAFGIYQVLPAQRSNPNLQQVGYLFALSCLANITWLFLWHYNQFLLTLVAMVTLLVLLITIYLRLGIGSSKAASNAEIWTVRVPFSIYLGWISVATVANVTEVLDYIHWKGFGISPEAWMIIVLVVVLGIVSAVSLTRADLGYMLVILWALVGIAVKQSGVPLVLISTEVTIGLVAVVTVVGVVLGLQRSRQAGGAASPQPG